jgi:hypothetical protein
MVRRQNNNYMPIDLIAIQKVHTFYLRTSLTGSQITPSQVYTMATTLASAERGLGLI